MFCLFVCVCVFRDGKNILTCFFIMKTEIVIIFSEMRFFRRRHHHLHHFLLIHGVCIILCYMYLLLLDIFCTFRYFFLVFHDTSILYVRKVQWCHVLWWWNFFHHWFSKENGQKRACRTFLIMKCYFSSYFFFLTLDVGTTVLHFSFPYFTKCITEEKGKGLSYITSTAKIKSLNDYYDKKNNNNTKLHRVSGFFRKKLRIQWIFSHPYTFTHSFIKKSH